MLYAGGRGLGRPTDFIDFAQATGGEVMYTINQSGTSKEAAALVAFFNGSVSDNTTIGVDVRGVIGVWSAIGPNYAATTAIPIPFM